MKHIRSLSIDKFRLVPSSQSQAYHNDTTVTKQFFIFCRRKTSHALLLRQQVYVISCIESKPNLRFGKDRNSINPGIQSSPSHHFQLLLNDRDVRWEEAWHRGSMLDWRASCFRNTRVDFWKTTNNSHYVAAESAATRYFFLEKTELFSHRRSFCEKQALKLNLWEQE